MAGGRALPHESSTPIIGASIQAPDNPMVTDCLNCGAALHGSFCSACGQRSVPPDPTVDEVAGDAWQELSGYDGRIAQRFAVCCAPAT